MRTFIDGVEQVNPELMKKVDALARPRSGRLYRLGRGVTVVLALVGIASLVFSVLGYFEIP